MSDEKTDNIRETLLDYTEWLGMCSVKGEAQFFVDLYLVGHENQREMETGG